MAAFTVRVELHDADSDDYKTLHAEMEKKGFLRTIERSDGAAYDLPSAEYNYIGDIERSDVLDRAKTATKATNRKGAILVTESAGRSWSGLDKV